MGCLDLERWEGLDSLTNLASRANKQLASCFPLMSELATRPFQLNRTSSSDPGTVLDSDKSLSRQISFKPAPFLAV